MSLSVQIITPQKKVFENTIESITCPALEGELTILSHHVPLFTPLVEGVVELKSGKDEHYFAIGGGYLETDGVKATILVSRAQGQDEINERAVAEAETRAKKMVTEAKTDEERQQAMQMLRRSIVDDKLLQRVRRRKH